MQTPRHRTAVRPSLAVTNTASSPALSLAARTALDRKASLNALTGLPPEIHALGPAEEMLGGDGRPIEVGDTVDVPGGMHGVIKYIGGVDKKKGSFVGVELSSEFAHKGKNDGDVEGKRYFTTSTPRAGIFLPISRASKRASLPESNDSFEETPGTPAFGASYGVPRDPRVPAMPKFSQSLGPGARAPSPQFKPKRPSLPRPESPLRNKPSLKPTPSRAVTPGRNPSLGPATFSKSAIGGPPRFTPSPGAGKIVKSRTNTPQPRKPSAFSRSPSRLTTNSSMDDGEITPSASPSPRSPSKETEEELSRLQHKLDERDRQLKEQAIALAEMESSVAELQSLIPTGTPSPSRSNRSGFFDDMDTAQLRALLREKNDKISQLTCEFDDHRQDFRSTIDALELASTETERVYEKRVDELMAELQEFHERDDDVASVAEQLKQLEELVAELEEGLEDARRGEAEARGEVEFLRGEVERGRSELRREREKAAAALKGAGDAVDGSGATARSSRDLEQRDDEIRGLKAIIHSLSSGPDAMTPTAEMPRSPLSPGVDATALHSEVERLMRETDELRGLVERKNNREEELEREIEALRRAASAQHPLDPVRDSVISSNGTATPSVRDSKNTVVNWRGVPAFPPPGTAEGRKQSLSQTTPLESMPEHEQDPAYSASEAESTMWCEYCDSSGHDILNCTSQDLGGKAGAAAQLRNLHLAEDDDAPDADPDADESLANSHARDDALSPAAANGGYVAWSPRSSSLLGEGGSGKPPSKPLPLPSPREEKEDQMGAAGGLVAGSGGDVDPEKWCALCECEGHDVTTCPDPDVM